jgi:hypothetical protein
MPVSPELARELAKDTLEVYSTAERALLELLAERLAAGIDSAGWADIKLAETTALRRAIQTVLEQLDRDGTEAAARAVQMAYQRGVATVARDLVTAGQIPEIAYTPIGNTRTIDTLIRATADRLRTTHLRVVRSTLDVYRTVIADASAQTAIGTATRRDAARAALGRFARLGVKGFVDSSGRAWDLVSYAEMSVRTTTAHAAVQGGLDRMTEAGRRLVIVSDSPEECPRCRPWEGKILAIDGRGGDVKVEDALTGDQITVRVAGTVRDATRGGLFHPNCTHSVSAYTPGVTKRYKATADPEGNALRNEQRRLERDVRQARKDLIVAEQFGSGPELVKAKARVAHTRDRLKSFVDDHDRKSLPYRTSLTVR